MVPFDFQTVNEMIDIINFDHSHDQNNTNTDINDCSCLNDIYDEIFVISIKSRHKTLSITLYQLNRENINYTLWEGHSSENPYSLELWHQFKQNIDKKNVSKTFLSGINLSLYYQKNAFFLRQTQIDILKYSKHNKLQKILIFEDDILLANPYWINMFCNIEPSIYSWLVLNIGINQGEPQKMIRHSMSVYDKNHSVQEEMKYYLKNVHSWGTFAISFSYEMYQELIDIFDLNSERVNVFPLDEYYYWFHHKTGIKYRCFNIHPTLILPDVTKSSLRNSHGVMERFIRNRTTDHNVSHFSKYWHLRFSNDSQLYVDKIISMTPSFEELISDSPSKLFLQK